MSAETGVPARALLAVGAFVAVAAAGPRPVPAFPDHLSEIAGQVIPHRVLYDLRAVDIRSGLSIVGADGRLAHEWRRDCEGWATSARLVLRLDYAERDDAVLDSAYASWEAPEGDEMVFHYHSTVSGDPLDTFRGEGRLEPDRTGGRVDFREPAGEAVALPEGTVFPTEHTLELLHRAAEGERFFSANVFEGSEGTSADEVVASIGDPLPPEENPESPLTEGPSWRVTLSYYDLEDPSNEPAYELTGRYYATGFVDELRLDYGDYAIEGTVVDTEIIEDAC